jgi:hypothetical protein
MLPDNAAGRQCSYRLILPYSKQSYAVLREPLFIMSLIRAYRVYWALSLYIYSSSSSSPKLLNPAYFNVTNTNGLDLLRITIGLILLSLPGFEAELRVDKRNGRRASETFDFTGPIQISSLFSLFFFCRSILLQARIGFELRFLFDFGSAELVFWSCSLGL